MTHMAMSLKGTFRGTTACEGVERADLVYEQRAGCPSNRFIALSLIILEMGASSCQIRNVRFWSCDTVEKRGGGGGVVVM